MEETLRFSHLRRLVEGLPPRLAVVAAAHDAHTLEGVRRAALEGVVRPLLVGNRDAILRAAGTLDWQPPSEEIAEAEGDEAIARRAVTLVREHGGLLVKGMLQTSVLLKAVVDRQTGLRGPGLLSHLAALDVPAYHKLLYITDGGMVAAPDLEQKRRILNNALAFCRAMGIDSPKVAVLCAAETVSPHMPETTDAAQLKAEGRAGAFGPCVVEGPISFDLATSAAAARDKGYDSPVAGDADILLVPSIVAGNLLAKALYGMAGGEMAGLVLGAQAPILVNSRGATSKEKYCSLLLGAALGRN